MNTTLLTSLANQFAKAIATPEFESHLADHAKRATRAQSLLTVAQIPALMEDSLRDLFFDSDSFNFWVNKEWALNKRLQTVGLDGIRHTLLELVKRGEHGLTVEDLHELLEMGGLGILLATELLTYRFPDKYWTYSANVTLPAFAALGEDVKANMPHGQKNGPNIYFALKPYLAQVRAALQAAGVPAVDYLLIDIFLWWVKEVHPATQPQLPEPPAPPVDNEVASAAVLALLSGSLQQAGLSYTALQIATFYTALQTKPFVILSGISGTGKTKLAQHFAALLPQPQELALETDSEIVTVTIQPYMLKYGRLIVPKAATRLFDPPAPGKQQDVTLIFDGQSQVCRLVHARYGDSDYLSLLLRGTARLWFIKIFASGDVLTMEPELDQDQNLTGFRMFSGANPVKPAAPVKTGQNWLFLPVRPDWRESKSLLGYYNPLTGLYEWTPFLRFLLRASQSYRAKDGLAWFAILDEMNLAHVEYYFSDLLSVMESGHDAEGWTRESLRLDYSEDADGDLPPHEIKLPSNLFVIGTVNVDETTHAFSPKVLDRAFTMELTDVDFSKYLFLPNPPTAANPISANQLLKRFTDNGKFASSSSAEKQPLISYLAVHSEIRTDLQTLNEMFRPSGMHFGYRVFDEIVWFLLKAEKNELFTALGGGDTALDAALLLKILPKLHGSRSKLEAPLRALLAWCIDSSAPAEQIIDDAIQQAEGQIDEALSQITYRYPRTAERARRILQALYNDGFAAFS